jgi:uncharacterized glyoxalase superfamily protein PhnB
MKVSKLTSNLAVADIRQTVRFYCENLGFELVAAVPVTQDGADQQLADGKEYVFVLLKKDNAELMFQRSDSFSEDVSIAGEMPVGASVSFYMQGNDIEAFHAELKTKDIRISELKQTWYGIKEFYIKDNNGYILGFAEEAAQ